jgi:hypothetical protein
VAGITKAQQLYYSDEGLMKSLVWRVGAGWGLRNNGVFESFADVSTLWGTGAGVGPGFHCGARAFESIEMVGVFFELYLGFGGC